MTTSDARKRNAEKETHMTDHRAEAERILRDDERRVVKPSGTRMDGAIVHALLAVHDTLTEIRDRLPEPVAVESEYAVGRFNKAFREAAARLDGTTRAAVQEMTGLTSDEVDDLGGLPEDVTVEPQEVGTRVMDVSGDLWWKTWARCWHRDDPEMPAECSTWAELERGYAPLRLATDADRERVDLPVDAAPDVDPDEALARVLEAADERTGTWLGMAREVREHIDRNSPPDVTQLLERECEQQRVRALLAEVDRLRAGIEALTGDYRNHYEMHFSDGGDYVVEDGRCVDVDDLRALLNPEETS